MNSPTGNSFTRPTTNARLYVDEITTYKCFWRNYS